VAYRYSLKRVYQAIDKFDSAVKVHSESTRELDSKPFSFLSQYGHVQKLRWRRADMNTNIALEYLPELTILNKFPVAEIDKCLPRQFFHL
jgi:hypothetical protein